MEDTNFRSRFLESLRLGAVEQMVLRVSDFAILLIILKALPPAELGHFGIATAALVFFSLVAVTPESIIFRSFAEWEKTVQLRTAIEAFQWFAVFRTVVVLIIALLLHLIFGVGGEDFGYILGYAFAVQLVQLMELGRIIFRVKLQQAEIVKIDMTLRTMLLALLLVLFFRPMLWVYLTLYIAWALMGVAVWMHALYTLTGARFRYSPNHLPFVQVCLSEFSLWHHFGAVSTYILYNIDPLVLAWAGFSTAMIGSYTLELKISNFFFVAPMFLQSMTSIMLANAPRERWHELTGRVLGWNGLLAVSQWLFFMVCGGVLVGIFASGKYASEDLRAMFWIGAIINTGVLLLNLSRPVVSYLQMVYDMKTLFFTTFLPAVGFGLVSYFVLTTLLGFYGTALASCVAYTVFSGLLIRTLLKLGQGMPDIKLEYSFIRDLIKSQ